MICPSLCAEILFSYILFLNALLLSPTLCLWHFVQDIKYMTLLNSQVMCLGKSLVWWDLYVNLHFTALILLIKGQ